MDRKPCMLQSRGHKESDTTQQLNSSNNAVSKKIHFSHVVKIKMLFELEVKILIQISKNIY